MILHVKTPASSANIGPGFDSLALALTLYNHLYIEECENEIEIHIKNAKVYSASTNKSNLIFRTIKRFYNEHGFKMPGIRMIQEDHIPAARGLGSSAACIVSGIVTANQLCNTNYDTETLIQLASKFEGHPDNVVAAILGDLAISVTENDFVHYQKLSISDDLDFVAIIPGFKLSTATSRKALPYSVPHVDAVFNSSRTAFLIASLYSRKYENLKIAIDDKIHQPYRKNLIPNMDNIFTKAYELGAKAVYLSGAGPTIFALNYMNTDFSTKMEKYLKTLSDDWSLKNLLVDKQGVSFEYIDRQMI